MSSAYRRALAISLIALLAACDPMAQDNAAKPLTEQEQSALQMAAQMRKNNNPSGASDIYRELIAHGNAPIESYTGLASIYRKNGKPNDAVATMLEAQKIAPANEKVLLHLGYALIAANKPEEAVNIFDLLTAINHGSAAGYNGKAVAFDNAGNHVAAQEIYQKALQIDPNSNTIQNNLALSMILNDQFDEAIGVLEPLSQKAAAPTAIRQNLALAYGLKGEKDRALSINLQDVSSDKAEENQRFYDHYATMRHKQKMDALTPQMQAVLPDAMEDSPEPVTLHKTPTDVMPSAGKASAAPVKPAASKTAIPEADADKNDGTFWGYSSERSYPADR